jgi:hypothetical protein
MLLSTLRITHAEQIKALRPMLTPKTLRKYDRHQAATVWPQDDNIEAAPE